MLILSYLIKKYIIIIYIYGLVCKYAACIWIVRQINMITLVVSNIFYCVLRCSIYLYEKK